MTPLVGNESIKFIAPARALVIFIHIRAELSFSASTIAFCYIFVFLNSALAVSFWDAGDLSGKVWDTEIIPKWTAGRCELCNRNC